MGYACSRFSAMAADVNGIEWQAGAEDSPKRNSTF
jgi:hypothetical protein